MMSVLTARYVFVMDDRSYNYRIMFPLPFNSLFKVESFSTAFIPRNHGLYTPIPSTSTASTGLTMKIFDWKRRTADESVLNDIENTIFTLDNLKAAPGARKRAMRKGRGIAAGKGATCGFGMRGQRSRSGNPQRPGFEGGQTPLYRRLPKFVGKPTGPGHTKTIYNIIPTSVLCHVQAGSTVSFNSLQELALVTKSKFTLHKVVLGRHDSDNSDAATSTPTADTYKIATNLKVQAHAFTGAARDVIEAAGGTCELLSKTTHQPLLDVDDEASSAASATDSTE
jgi:large subunit ribosomal protein L15